MNSESHDKAWNFLEEKGLTLRERMFVRANFADVYKHNYPFIVIEYEKGEVKYYSSEIDDIKRLMFNTEKEVILANAIYENVKDKFEINEFIQMLKFTFRILNTSSIWA